MEKQHTDDSSSKEATKTWGFRRSTIARREFIEEIGNLDLITLMPRRNTRQPRGRGRGRGRGKQPSETTSDAPKRARGGRRAVQPNLEPDPEPQPGSDDLITASRELDLPQKTASDTEASDQAEDSDELTLRELQERARKRQKSEENTKGGAGTADPSAETVNEDDEASRDHLQSDENVSSLSDRMTTSSEVITESRKSARGVQLEEEEEEEEQNEADESSGGDEEYSDPNAIYCICQQKHNNRFMICCDRCHEWFHGDCVGISQARGRLLEKNGEDYICPSCSPCQSPIDVLKQQPALSKAALSSSSESLFTSSAGEERPSEDEGIKGKIRKSSTRSTKRRIKIFQPVEVVEATSEPKEQAVVREQALAEEMVKDQEDVVEKVKEKAAVPKCIGPGCSNDALPESVYCGHQCIIRHAAVAMHGLSEPKAQPEIKNKPAPKPTLKIHNLGKLFKKKSAEKPAEDEDGRSKETGSTPAASLTPDPVHKAMGEQQPAAIASSQFYKAMSTKSEKEAAESKPDKTPVTTQTETQNPSAPSEAPAAEKATEKPAPSAPPLKKPGSNPLPSRAKKTMPGSPRLSASRQLLNEASQANKCIFTVPKKPSQSQEDSNVPQASNSAPEVRVLPVTPAPVPPSRPLQTHPNMQMRQNIRRSLTDTLLKRLSDSDDLDIPESEVEKLAVNIEREMFNMYYTTDNKYKIKYRSLLLSLKDPKNKGLFYQVVKGHITPFKLTRLSDQELLSVQESTANFVPLKEQPSPDCVDMEQPLSVSESKVVKTDSVPTSSSEGMSLAQVRQAQIKKPSTAVSEIISSMLKDTTAEHKAHLFDLKCRICTGQISADEDPDAKTLKKDEPKNEQEDKPPCTVPLSDKKPPSAALGDDSAAVMESPASPTAEDCSAETAQTDFSPPVIPAVSIVTITRRDPRTAGYRAAPSPFVIPAPASVPAPVPAPAPLPVSALVPVPDPPKSLSTIPSDKETVEETKAAEPPQPPAPPPPMPKSILMKPSAPSIPRFYSSPSLTTRLPSSHTPADSETSHFLSRQDTIWKGFLNMQLVAKFVTKGCIISGSAEVLKKDLPDTVHIGGRILPQTVWEYVERVKTSLTKELSLIRFYPASDEEEVAYVSLFSYFNSRSRFGVVSNICNNIKDLYLIPLCANESIPSVLLPIEGPGLEQNHPNLLIGLAVCQKLKRPGAQTQDIDEKRPRIQTLQDPQVMNLPTKSAVPDVKNDEPYDPDIALSTTPPESPPSLRSPDSSSSSLNLSSGTLTLSNIHALVTPPAYTSADVAKITSSSVPPVCGTSSTTTTPLQTILNTIFGKKKQGPDSAMNTSETTSTAVKEPAIPSPTVDPIIQQYQQTPKTTVEFDDNDRPYDPEEEYDPALGYQNLTPSKPLELSKPNTLPAGANDDDGDDDRPYDPEEEYNLGNKVDSVHTSNTTKYSDTEPLLGASAIKDDVAYDPEDDTVFEEMQNYLTDNKSATSEYGTSSTMSLSEQQKMLEDLNRQIEEQKRQLEEQEEALRLQRAAVGVSMAHFSVSDALMSPPPRFGREPDEEMEKSLTASAINLNRDPRQYRHLRQNAVNPSAMGHTDKENVNEKRESSKTKCLANNSLEKDLSKNDQVMSLGKLDDKRSMNADTTVLRSVRNSEKSTHLGASELQEGTSSSGNENIQHSHSPSKDSGKTRQSRTSRRQHHSPPQRRSRHETRRSYHEKRTSDQSKDDGNSRRGRRSPERSSRRSRSRSRRKGRASSRERERHHHKSTSSRHSSRRDRQYSSSRSRSTRSRTSPKLENNPSNQKENSASKQKNEPNTDSTDSANNVASEQSQIQSDKSQNEASGSGESKITKIQKGDITKPETDQSCHREQPKKQEQLEPNQIKANPLQREDFQKNKPQSEKLSIQQGRNSESHNTRHQHGSQRGNVLHNNETDFSHGTDEQSSWQESDHLPQRTPKIEKEDFLEPDKAYSRNSRKVLPQRPPHLQGNDPEMMPPQNQKSSFSMDDTLHPRDCTPQGAHSMASVDLPQLEDDIHRNIHHPRDQFRPRAPEVQWRGPQHRMGGPRGHTPVQPRIPRAPHPERFESCRPAGPRGPRPRILDDCGPSQDFGPRGPTSVPRMFQGSGPRSFRQRGPSPVPRMFEGASPQPSGSKGRFPRPGMFEGSGPQNFGPRDAFSGPNVFDGSVHFAGSSQREFDTRDPHLQDFDDSWGCDVPHQVDREPFSEFRRPRGRGPPQQFHENMPDSRASEQANFNDSRHCDPPFDEAEIGHLPLQYSDDSRDYDQNFANESFLNPQEPRGQRNPTPHPKRTRSPVHARNPPHNQPEGSQFPGMELNVKKSHQFDDFRVQAIERETVNPHFSKPDIFEGGRGCERAAQMKGPRFNPPQNFRGPRAPSPHFRDQRMPPPRNTELPEDKPRSPHFSLPSTSKPPRPQVPNASEFQNPIQSRILLDGPTKEPDIRPLRLSGPLLPTPPGGPIRFHNPRMQRPYLYNECNLPQRPPTRGHMGDLGKAGLKSGSFDDSNSQEGETCQGFIQEGEMEEFVDREEEYSSQDNGPGKPWCREARRRNSTARRGHSSE
ncbi:death-inducer obliterator 1 [Pangasianodon hypophthalmus]|uniref:death-inducer obliterator 1 n=1 Tax=Pangasianodon hypophthalmus TaxID=310915 RepID=UPI002307704A|nr:death-inducer obliterator 1 [Pangasianodon hypophthalmus]XP_026800792.3 death-inducer obliterator 1 [Pangasianodon hypophthalmus]